MMQDKKIGAHILMIIWASLIATSFPVASLVAGELSSSGLTSLRFLVASLIFLPFLLKEKSIIPNYRELFAYFILALSLSFYFWSMFRALEETTALNTGSIFTLIPALTAFISYYILKSKSDKKVLFALFIGCMGSLLVVVRGDVNKIINLDLSYGDFIFFIGCIVLALYSPLIQYFKYKKFVDRTSVFSTFWVLAIGTIILSLYGLYEGKGDLKWMSLEADSFAIIIYLAIFTTMITFWQIQYCTPILGSIVVMSYTYLIPTLLFLIELMFFNRTFEQDIYIGIILTLISLFILNSEVLLKCHKSSKGC